MSDHNTGHVGLDVHKDSTAIGIAELGRGARYVGTVGPQLRELVKALGKLGEGKRLKIVYEAGPCGYGLVRELRARGYDCEVIAPSKVARRPGDRVKTDRRDALHLAEQSQAGALRAVWVMEEAEEAIRDLSRAREDAVRARLKARQRLGAMLLRHGRRYSGKTKWTAAHERYLAQVSFAYPAQELAYVEYRQAVSESQARVERLSEALREQVSTWRMRPVVEALMTLRGIDFVAGTTLVAELGDLRRFAHPSELMSFLGLVPSEHTTGQARRLGAITRTGNGYARRMLVEAAWNYRYPARIGRALQVRQQGQSKTIRDLSWQAQVRLCRRYRALSARRLHANKICVAVARELAGYVWAIATKAQRNA
jgi:transposase